MSYSSHSYVINNTFKYRHMWNFNRMKLKKVHITQTARKNVFEEKRKNINLNKDTMPGRSGKNCTVGKSKVS